MISTEFLITSLIVVLMPGTGVLYTVATALFKGGKASIYAAIGCTLGIVPSLIASVLGLAVIFHISAILFQIVKFAGVAYLLYLAWSMWHSSTPLVVSESNKEQNWLSIAIKGFLINILNPKLTIFFLAFLPQFLPHQTDNALFNMMFLGAVFMLMTFAVFVIYGLLANSIRDYIIHSERVSLFMQKLFAGSFAALGIKLALTDRG